MPCMSAPFGDLQMVPMKSLLLGLTHMDAPEFQMTVKLSFGSMAALQAIGCCRTTDLDDRQLQGQVVQTGGVSDGSLVGISAGSLVGISEGSFVCVFDGSIEGPFDG